MVINDLIGKEDGGGKKTIHWRYPFIFRAETITKEQH